MTPYAIVLLFCMTLLLLSSLFHRMAYHLQLSQNSKGADQYSLAAMLTMIVALIGAFIGMIVCLTPPA